MTESKADTSEAREPDDLEVANANDSQRANSDSVRLKDEVSSSANDTDATNTKPPSVLFSRFSKFVKLTFLLGCLVPSGLFVFSFFGKQFFLAELISNFRVQITGMLFVATLLLFLIRQQYWGWINYVMFMWFWVGVLTIYWPANGPPPGPDKIKIMSYNVLASNWKAQEVVDSISKHDVDVVVVLEYARSWHITLDCLNEEYPHQVRVPRWHGFGIGIFSKYPLSESTTHQLTKNTTDNPFVVTHVDVGGQKVRLAALHVLSPTGKKRLLFRNQQFEEVAELLSTKTTPTVLMGDFNCTVWSPYLQELIRDSGLRDSRQGFGTQSSWPANNWWVRIPIDHVLVSDDIHVHDRFIGEAASSDHLPVIFEVSVAKE